MSKKSDLRVLRTKKYIHDSFIELLNEKGFDCITINDISNKACINRSTFYLHYTDKFHLLDEIFTQSLGKLLVLIVPPETYIKNGVIDATSFTQNLHLILKTIANDALFYQTMLKNTDMINFKRKMEFVIRQKFLQSFHGNPLVPKDLFLEFLLSLYMGTIVWWLDNNMAYSPSFMAEQLVRLLTMSPVEIAGLTTVRDTMS